MSLTLLINIKKSKGIPLSLVRCFVTQRHIYYSFTSKDNRRNYTSNSLPNLMEVNEEFRDFEKKKVEIGFSNPLNNVQQLENDKSLRNPLNIEGDNIVLDESANRLSSVNYEHVDIHKASSPNASELETGIEIKRDSMTFSPLFDFARNRIGMVSLPEPIYTSMQIVLKDHPIRLLKEEAPKLSSDINAKNPFMAKIELNCIQRTPASVFSSKLPYFKDEGEKEALAYLAVQSPYTYGPIKKVFYEISKRLADFSPKSLLDFGTGCGSVLWAAADTWNSSLKKFTAVDLSEDMLQVAEKVIQNVPVSSSLYEPLSKVSFKRYLSFSNTSKKSYDVVVSAFTLSDIVDDSLRKLTLDNLWSRTNDLLILIDRGTPRGYQLILEARNHILGLTSLTIDNTANAPSLSQTNNDDLPSKNITDENLKKPLNRQSKISHSSGSLKTAENTADLAHVVAPCPHGKPCPMAGSWCHFSQRTQLTGLQMNIMGYKMNVEDQKYSYVVLRRGPRPTDGQKLNIEKYEEQSYQWKRIIVPPYKKARHVVIDACSSEGQLQRITVPKSQGKDIYYDARKSHWGDLWPHPVKGNPIIHSDFSKKGRNRSG